MKTFSRKNLLEKIAQTESISGSPPSISLTNFSPNIYKIFGQATAYINHLCQYLNQIIFYLSNGKYYLDSLFKNINSIDTSSILDKNLRNLIEFSRQLFFHIFLTKNNPRQHISLLENNQNLQNLSYSNPKGQLATKIPQGDIKTNIKNYLTQIKNLSPQQ